MTFYHSEWQVRGLNALAERWFQADAHVKAYRWHLHMLSFNPDYLDDIAERRRQRRLAEPTNDHIHENRPFADNE